MGAYGWAQHGSGTSLEQAFSSLRYDDNDHNGITGVAQATTQVCHPLEARLLCDQLDSVHDLTPEHRWDDDEARTAAEAVAKKRASELLLRLGVAPASGGSRWGSDSRHSLPTAEKWGSAYGIPTADPSAFKETTRAVPLEATSLVSHGNGTRSAAVIERLHEALTEQLGWTPRMANIEVLDDSPRYTKTVTATEGAVKTRYRVYHRNVHGQLTQANKETYPSMAAARAAIKVLIEPKAPDNSNPYSNEVGDVEYVALGEKVREDGSPLLVGKRTLMSRLVIYKVTLVTPKTPSPAISGWQIYGVTAD